MQKGLKLVLDESESQSALHQEPKNACITSRRIDIFEADHVYPADKTKAFVFDGEDREIETKEQLKHTAVKELACYYDDDS